MVSDTPRSIRVNSDTWDAAMERAISEKLSLNAVLAAFVARYASGKDSLDAVPGYPRLRVEPADTPAAWRVVREVWSKPPGERYASHLADQTIAELSTAELLGLCAGVLQQLADANP
jgi:hypothetical protein